MANTLKKKSGDQYYSQNHKKILKEISMKLKYYTMKTLRYKK